MTEKDPILGTADSEVEPIAQRAEALLTDERFTEIKRMFEEIEPGDGAIATVQNMIREQGNKLRVELGLTPIEIDDLTCGGFDPNDQDADGNPIILSYVDNGMGIKIGHSNKTTSGNFIPDSMGLRTALLAFCEV